MKSLAGKILAAASLAAALIPAGTASAQEVTLKLSHFLPIQANIPKNILEPWAERIEAESNGRIKIDRFYAMALGGKPTELMDQVLDGVAEMTLTVTGYTPGRWPPSSTPSMPSAR